MYVRQWVDNPYCDNLYAKDNGYARFYIYADLLLKKTLIASCGNF